MKLLLINNPWGRNVYDENIGKYCLENLNDNVMNLKPYIESNLNSKDGTFWIDYDTFVKNYTSINVCKIPCNYHCINFSLSNQNFFELPMIYKLKIDKKTNIWFNINISNSKAIRNHLDEVTIFKFFIINQINDEGKIIKTYSEKKGIDDIQTSYDLEQGNYIIWIYIPKKNFTIVNEIKADFRVSSDNKVDIKFINYDTDFKYIIDACEYLFNINNEISMNEDEDKLIKCLMDAKMINGLIVVYFKNNTKDKKIDVEPESKCDGFKPIINEEKIDFKNLKFTLMPNECIYYVGISLQITSVLSFDGIKLNYTECQEEIKQQSKSYNFTDYINDKNIIDEKITINKYETNPYCYIKTNFNKNKEERNEKNVFNYFFNLMKQKLKGKVLNDAKVKIIAADLWNKMKEEEKEKIRKKYNLKKKELKNNVIKTQVLKFIRRNSLKISDKNKMDNEIQNMKLKTRLSKELEIVQFEDDLDELEDKIKNILPRIEKLKETEKDEIELDQHITKLKSISEEIKKLAEEKITQENLVQIDEQKCKIAKEYLLFSEKLKVFLERHKEQIKAYDEINEEGKRLSEEIDMKIKSHKEKKLDLKIEMNNLIKKFNGLIEETKKLKLIEINKKYDKEVVQRQEEIHNNLNAIQNGLKSSVENIQNELLSQEKFDTISKKQTELSNELNKYNEINNEFNEITEIIQEEQNFIKELEPFYNNIKEANLQESFDLFKNHEKTQNELAEKINNFEKNFIPKVNNYNEYIKQNDNCKKEILDIYKKFEEKNVKISESLDKLFLKTKDLYDEIKSLKINDLVEKSKEMKSNWEKVMEIYNNILEKLKKMVENNGGILMKFSKKNTVDNEIQNMELKRSLSKGLEKAQFEDELENKIKNILPRIEKLKETEKDEIELDQHITKLNSISEEIKKLVKETITQENYIQIDEQKCKIAKEFLLFSGKLGELLKKHQEQIKVYDEINEEVKRLSEEIDLIIKSYNEKKLDLKKELNDLIRS